MRILLVDDHDLVRDTISAFLDREPDLEVRAAEGLERAEALIAEEEPFDLVLLDYAIPGADGLCGFTRIREASGGRPVAIMSGTARRQVAEEALEKGAAGFLPKTIPAASLVNAVRFMATGERYVPFDFLNGKEEAPPEAALAASLSERERQVLDGVCHGYANKEIARELGLQEVTVKLHLKTLCRKLGARNRTHAAMIAKDAGLV